MKLCPHCHREVIDDYCIRCRKFVEAIDLEKEKEAFRESPMMDWSKS